MYFIVAHYLYSPLKMVCEFVKKANDLKDVEKLL